MVAVNGAPTDGRITIEYRRSGDTRWRYVDYTDLTEVEPQKVFFTGYAESYRFIVEGADGTGSVIVSDTEFGEAVTPYGLYGSTNGMTPEEIGGAISLFASFENTGAWTTATNYTINQLWSDGGNWYLVLENYTSGASAAADIAGGTVAQYEPSGRTWQVYSIGQMEALTPLKEGQAVYLSAGGRSGTFIWDSSDLSAEVSADTLQGVYIAPSSDATGASGAWVRKLDGYVTPEMFGFLPGVAFSDETTAASNLAAFNAAVSLCPEGHEFKHESPGVVNGPVVMARGYITVKWIAQLYPSDGFTGDYLVTNTYEEDEDYFRWPLTIEQMYLDCRGITRGLYSVSMDHVDWDNIRVENPYGSGIFIDRMRESKISFPQIINGRHRERFTTPSDWSSGTAYTAGEYARVVDPAWSSVTAYSPDDIVRYSGNRYICKSDSTNEQPDTNPLVWQQIPHEDYICVLDNTNKDPQQYNTNTTLEADRYWQKAYQDEACIEISDIVTVGDRSNQIALFEPIIRDCGNKCYLRVDSSKLPARPVTHFDIVFGHIHGQPIAQAGGEIPIPDLQRIIELGYVINTNIIGTNIRCGDGDNCIGVMIGDGGTTKVAQDTRFKASVISGDGLNDIGVIVMPSTQASNSSEADLSYLVTDTNATDIHDPRRTFRRNVKAEQRCLLPSGLASVPGGYTVVGPAGEYSIVRPYSYSEEGSSQPRLDVNITGSSSEIRFGPGGSTSPDVILRRNSASRLSTNAELRLETGDYTQPLIFGTYRVWVETATGNLRIKSSAPVSDSDGTVVGTQT